MAGKHRRSRRSQSVAKRGWVSSLAAAAVTVTSLTTALTTGTTVTVSPAIELTATITPASSTAQIIASPTFYGYDYTQTYGQQQISSLLLRSARHRHCDSQQRWRPAGQRRGVLGLGSRPDRDRPGAVEG